MLLSFLTPLFFFLDFIFQFTWETSFCILELGTVRWFYQYVRLPFC